MYCIVSLKGGLPQDNNASIYSIATTFYILFTNAIHNSDANIPKKKQKL